MKELGVFAASLGDPVCLTGRYNPRSLPTPRGRVTAMMRELSCLAKGVDFYHTKFLALVHAK